MDRYPHRIGGWTVVVSLATAAGLMSPIAPGAPIPAEAVADVRTYQFTARVTKNAGVTPFAVGARIEGVAAYDRRGTAAKTSGKAWAHYESPNNALSFRLGDVAFRAAGPVTATVSVFDAAETFGVVAGDLVLPTGWDMSHERRSQTYGVLFQNAPPRRVLTGLALPDRVSLADFRDTRELRLDFAHGVTFPGGRVTDRATVFATVESFTAAK